MDFLNSLFNCFTLTFNSLTSSELFIVFTASAVLMGVAGIVLRFSRSD